ncbi:MAG: hypothetical protein AB7U85_11045 [Alphaproteobacteria bacterium]
MLNNANNNIDMFEKKKGRPFKANAKPAALRQREFKENNPALNINATREVLDMFNDIAKKFKTKREAFEHLVKSYRG